MRDDDVDHEAALERAAERDDWIGRLCEIALADNPEDVIDRE